MLVELLECTVGKRLKMLLNLHVYGVPGTVRFSTVVMSIEPTDLTLTLRARVGVCDRMQPIDLHSV